MDTATGRSNNSSVCWEYYAHLFLCVLFVPSILYVRSGITIIYVLWSLLARYRAIYGGIRPKIGSSIWLGLIFIAVLISGFNSENIAIWSVQLRIYAPFALMPIVFGYLPKLKEEDLLRLLYWVFIVMLVSAAIVCLDSLLSIASVTDQIRRGASIYTPIEHVKYSMFNAFVLLAMIWVYLRYKLKHRRLVLLGILALFIMMHWMATRSGLVISYTGLFIIAFLMIKREGFRAQISKLIGAMLISTIIAFLFFPTLQAKIGYMKHDWLMGQSHYSDSARRISNRLALSLWHDSPILGVGGGDALHEAQGIAGGLGHQSSAIMLPHSQFILVLVRSGLLGLSLFLLGWLMPLRSLRSERHAAILVLLYWTYGLSFLVENSFERSISVAFFLFVFLLIQGKSVDRL